MPSSLLRLIREAKSLNFSLCKEVTVVHCVLFYLTQPWHISGKMSHQITWWNPVSCEQGTSRTRKHSQLVEYDKMSQPTGKFSIYLIFQAALLSIRCELLYVFYNFFIFLRLNSLWWEETSSVKWFMWKGDMLLVDWHSNAPSSVVKYACVLTRK